MKFIPHFTTSVMLTAVFVLAACSKLLQTFGMDESLAFIIAFFIGFANLINLGDSEPPLINN